MHEAALKENTDTDTLSFIHTVRVIRCKLPRLVSQKRNVFHEAILNEILLHCLI